LEKGHNNRKNQSMEKDSLPLESARNFWKSVRNYRGLERVSMRALITGQCIVKAL